MAKLDNEILQLRNQLGATVRKGGDVAAARADLEVAKAARSINVAVSSGATEEQRRVLAHTALRGRPLRRRDPGPVAPGAVYFSRRSDLSFTVVAVQDGYVKLRGEDGSERDIGLNTLKKSYKRDA